MKLLVLGASGGTGHHVVSQALTAGHVVTALVRTPAKFAISHDRLRVVAGSVTEPAAFTATHAFSDQDAVVCALGVGSSLKAEGLLEHAVPLLLSTMKSVGVRRLIFTSAIGVGAAYHEAPLLSRMLIRLLLTNIYADKAIAERLVRSSEGEWTIVQPARLTNGPLTQQYRHAIDLKESGLPKISRADVADFLLKQLSERSYVRRIVRVAY